MRNPSDIVDIQARSKNAVIVFIVLNSISIVASLFCLFIYFETRVGVPRAIDYPSIRNNFILLFGSFTGFAGSTYAVFTALMLTTGTNAALCKSGAIASMIAGAALMCLPILHVPVAIWLIKKVKPMATDT